MTRRTLTTATIIGLLFLIVPTAALAKGASEATITGPGIGRGIKLEGEGGAGGATLMELAQDAGFFPSLFRAVPNPMRTAQPAGALGPRYTIVYVMPGPNGVDEIKQEVYPYATPTPVSYVKPGQPYFGTQRTIGGWFVAGPTLKNDLVAVGLPATAPALGDGWLEIPWRAIGALLLVAALVGLALVLARLRRRTDTGVESRRTA
jgi:hypothetical protein